MGVNAGAGVLKTGEPCTRDENCDKCKGKYGCGRVYGPGTEPAPCVYSGTTNPKDTRFEPGSSTARSSARTRAALRYGK